jgi:predicted site-specific integrase-resolvase
MAVTVNPQPLISTMHTPLKAVLYARVSSEEQRERQSIETQIDSARQQCERGGRMKHNFALLGKACTSRRVPLA